MKKSIPLVIVGVALLAALAGCAVIATPIPPTFTATAIPPTFTPEPTLTPIPSPTIKAELTSTPPVDVLKFFTDMGATVMSDADALNFAGNIVPDNGLQRISSSKNIVVFDPWDRSINFVYTKDDLDHYLKTKKGKIIVISDSTLGLDNEARGGSIILKAFNAGVRIKWTEARLKSSLQTDLFMGYVSEWKNLKNNPLDNYNLSIIDCSGNKPKWIGYWLTEKGTFDDMVKYLEAHGYKDKINSLKFVASIVETGYARKIKKLPIIKEDW